MTLRLYKGLRRTTPVLQSGRKYYATSTLYYEVLRQFYSVLQSTFPYYKVLLQYYSVLQNTRPVLLHYYKVLLQYYSVLESRVQ